MTHPKTSCRQHSPATKYWLVGAVEAGESVSKAATQLGLTDSTAHDIIKNFLRQGNTENKHCPHPPTNVEGLKAAVHAAWEELDVADVDKHILHMPDRITAIFQTRGGHTHF